MGLLPLLGLGLRRFRTIPPPSPPNLAAGPLQLLDHYCPLPLWGGGLRRFRTAGAFSALGWAPPPLSDNRPCRLFLTILAAGDSGRGPPPLSEQRGLRRFRTTLTPGDAGRGPWLLSDHLGPPPLSDHRGLRRIGAGAFPALGRGPPPLCDLWGPRRFSGGGLRRFLTPGACAAFRGGGSAAFRPPRRRPFSGGALRHVRTTRAPAALGAGLHRFQATGFLPLFGLGLCRHRTMDWPPSRWGYCLAPFWLGIWTSPLFGYMELCRPPVSPLSTQVQSSRLRRMFRPPPPPPPSKARMPPLSRAWKAHSLGRYSPWPLIPQMRTLVRRSSSMDSGARCRIGIENASGWMEHD